MATYSLIQKQQYKSKDWRRPGQVKTDWFGASWGTGCSASRCEHAFKRSNSVAVLGRSRRRLLAAGGDVALASAVGGGVGDGDLAVARSSIGQVPNLQPVLFHWTEQQYFCKQKVRQSGRGGKHSPVRRLKLLSIPPVRYRCDPTSVMRALVTAWGRRPVATTQAVAVL